jgi:hypothetical protein
MNKKVNVYKMVVQVINFEGSDNLDDIIESIENNRYYNVIVRDTKKVEIDWTDEHPLNKNATSEQTFFDLFKE